MTLAEIKEMVERLDRDLLSLDLSRLNLKDKLLLQSELERRLRILEPVDFSFSAMFEKMNA